MRAQNPNERRLYLPDGRYYRVPDWATDEQIEEFRRNHPEILDDPTTLGAVGQGILNIPKGAAQTALGAGLGITALLPGDTGAAGWIRSKQQDIAESVDPRYRDSYISQLGQGLGSAATFMVPGMGAAGLAGRGAGIVASAALGSLSGVGEQAERMAYLEDIGEDISAAERLIATLGGAAIGSTEALPLGRLLPGGKVFEEALEAGARSSLGKVVQPWFSSALKQGLEEGAQEFGAGLGQNVVSRAYDPEVPIVPDFRDATVGFGTGVIMDLATRGLTAGYGRLARSADYVKERGLRLDRLPEVTEDAAREAEVARAAAEEAGEEYNPAQHVHSYQAVRGDDGMLNIVDETGKVVAPALTSNEEASQAINTLEQRDLATAVAGGVLLQLRNQGLDSDSYMQNLGMLVRDPNTSHTPIEIVARYLTDEGLEFGADRAGISRYSLKKLKESEQLQAILDSGRSMLSMQEVRDVLPEEQWEKFASDMARIGSAELAEMNRDAAAIRNPKTGRIMPGKLGRNDDINKKLSSMYESTRKMLDGNTAEGRKVVLEDVKVDDIIGMMRDRGWQVDKNSWRSNEMNAIKMALVGTTKLSRPVDRQLMAVRLAALPYRAGNRQALPDLTPVVYTQEQINEGARLLAEANTTIPEAQFREQMGERYDAQPAQLDQMIRHLDRSGVIRVSGPGNAKQLTYVPDADRMVGKIKDEVDQATKEQLGDVPIEILEEHMRQIRDAKAAREGKSAQELDGEEGSPRAKAEYVHGTKVRVEDLVERINRHLQRMGVPIDAAGALVALQRDMADILRKTTHYVAGGNDPSTVGMRYEKENGEALIHKNTLPGERPWRVTFFSKTSSGPYPNVHMDFETESDARDFIENPPEGANPVFKGFRRPPEPTGAFVDPQDGLATIILNTAAIDPNESMTVDEVFERLLPTLDYELMRWFRNYDYFTQNEWESMRRMADRTVIPEGLEGAGLTWREWAKRSLGNPDGAGSEEAIYETAIARAFEEYASGNWKPERPTKITTSLLDRMRRDLKEFVGIGRDAHVAPALSVFNQLRRGDIGGKREAGLSPMNPNPDAPVRSLLYTERGIGASPYFGSDAGDATRFRGPREEEGEPRINYRDYDESRPAPDLFSEEGTMWRNRMLAEQHRRREAERVQKEAEEALKDILSHARVEGDRIGMSLDESLVKKLGANMYRSNPAQVVVKEAIQNSVDAVKELGGGTVSVKVGDYYNERADKDSVYVVVSDDGVGMDSETVANQFMDIGGSKKAEGASGGYGLAKVGLLGSADNFVLRTTHSGVTTTIEGSPDDWVAGNLIMNSRPATEGEVGTELSIWIDPEVEPDYGSGLAFLARASRLSRVDGVTIEDISPPPEHTNVPYAADVARTGHRESDFAKSPSVSVDTRGATVNIYPSNAKAEYPTYQAVILNNGLYQFTVGEDGGNIYGLSYDTHGGSMPKDVAPMAFLVDVVPTVDTDEFGYPFTTSREDVSKAVMEALTGHAQSYVKDSAKTEVSDLFNLITKPVQVPGTAGKVYATRAGFADDLAERLAGREYAQKTIDAFARAHEAAYAAIEPLWRKNINEHAPEFGGFGFEPGWIGLNIQRTRLAEIAESIYNAEGRADEFDESNFEVENNNLILYNPYMAYEEGAAKISNLGRDWQYDYAKYEAARSHAKAEMDLIDDDLARGAISLSEHASMMNDQLSLIAEMETALKKLGPEPILTAEFLADRTWGVLVHEIAHESSRGHETRFSAAITRMLGDAVTAYTPEIRNRLADAWDVLMNSKEFRKDVAQILSAETKPSPLLKRISDDSEEYAHLDPWHDRRSDRSRASGQSQRPGVEAGDTASPDPTGSGSRVSNEESVRERARSSEDGADLFRPDELSQEEKDELRAKRREEIEGAEPGQIPRVGHLASPEALNVYYNTRDHSGKLGDNVRFRYSRKNNLSKEDPYIEGMNDPLAYDPDDRTVYETIVDALQSPSLLDDAKENFDHFSAWFRSEFVDKREMIERVSKAARAKAMSEGEFSKNLYADQAAIAAFRFMDASMHYVKSAITQGQLTYTGTDPSRGYYRTDALYDSRGRKYKGLKDVFAVLRNPRTGENDEKQADRYLVSKRIIQLHEHGDPAAKHTPGGMTLDQAREYVRLTEADPARAHIVQFGDAYSAWNNSLIDLAVRTGILPESEAEVWKNKSYVPFTKKHFRDEFDGLKKFANKKDRAVRKTKLEQELEGSEESIDKDLVTRIVANAEMIIRDAMRNVSHARLARDLTNLGQAEAAEKTDVNVLNYYEDGVEKYVKVDDPWLVQAALTGGESVVTGIWRWLGPKPAALLRESVTRNPAFVARNLLRDTLSAAITSGADFVPLADTLKQFNRSAFELAEKLGIAMEHDFVNDEARYRKQIANLIKRDDHTAKGVFMKAWNAMGDWSRMSDAATRMAVYEDVLTRTGNEAEAIYQAFEVINFGRRGRNPLWRAVLSSVPFLNARIQGLDVLYRAGAGRYTANADIQDDPTKIRNRFLLRGMFLGAMTGLYYALASDNEWYENQRDEVKDDYWLIPVGGDVLASIPVPFEVGLLFKTFPEQMMRRVFEEGYTPERHLESLKRAGTQTANFRPTPQILAPLVDVLANRNSFTGESIVPPYMLEALEDAEQRDMNTNELAALVGEALGVSPMKIEYLINGYLGPLGTYAAMVGDKVARQGEVRTMFEAVVPWTDLPQIAGGAAGTRQDMMSIRSAPVLRQLFRDAKAGGGYQQQFYSLRANTDRAVARINKAIEERRVDDVIAARHEGAALMAIRPTVNMLDRYMQRWRERRDFILMNRDLTDDDKRSRLRLLEEERDRQLAIVPFLVEISDRRKSR